MSTPLMPTLRTGAFSAVTLFSFIVLALSAHFTSRRVFTYDFAALGIATAVLSLLSLPVMLLIDNIRKGALTSMILVEIAWLGLLWVLWVATAGTSSQWGMIFGSEVSAIQAFSHLAWLVLFGYLGTLITFSIIAANRGYNRVWYQSVKETEFNAPPVQPAPMQAQQIVPAQNTGVPQAVYPPQGSPVPGWAGQPQQVPVGFSHPQA